MNRKIIALSFLLALAALPAAAYTRYDECHGHWTRWQVPKLTFQLQYLDFPDYRWQEAVREAQEAWTKNARGSQIGLTMKYVDYFETYGPGNGKNEIRIAQFGNWDGGSQPAVTVRRFSDCAFYNPFDVAHYIEADIVLNPQARDWDTSTNPAPNDAMKNVTMVLVHELGHVFGLNHEDAYLARMNSGWPGMKGGPIGSSNLVHVLGDDARGIRAAYGQAEVQRDLAPQAVYLASPGVAKVLPTPGWTFRNASLSFPFTVHNLGTNDETFQVSFYLSPTKSVSPNTSFLLGSTTVSLLTGKAATGTATVFIPENAPAGNQYIGWVVDPGNQITEFHESNNGVTFTGATYISEARVPNACFSATPKSGTAPLTVSFNAGCTTDADGGPLTYTWDFGDGTTATGPTVTHTYAWANNFVATLTVTDQYGAVDSTGEIISVSCGNFCPDEPY